MSGCFGMFGFCCCCQVNGPWDFYQDGPGTNTGDIPPPTYGLPLFSRTAAIYLDDDPPENLVFDYDSNEDWIVDVSEVAGWENFQHKITVSSNTPLGIIDEDYAYFYLQDGGENDHFSKKTFRFTDDTEGFEDQEDNSTIFQWDGEGHAQFFRDGDFDPDDYSERAIWSGNWEDLNVPNGATVTKVDLVSFKRKLDQVVANISHALAIRFLASDGVTPILDDDLYAAVLPTSVDGSFVTLNGTEQNVTDSITYGPSTTDIKIEIDYDMSISSFSAGTLSLLLDDIRFDITHTGAPVYGNAQIDAETKEPGWAIVDSDWLDIGADAPMGDVPILPIVGSGAVAFSPFAIIEPVQGVQAGACSYNDGLFKWTITDGIQEYREWKIDFDGNITYYFADFFQEWQDANPGFNGWEIPHYTSEWGYADPYDYPDNYGQLQAFLGYHLPQASAGQANIAYGYRQPHLNSLPPYDSGYGSYWPYVFTFTGSVEVAAGPVEYDEYGFPFIASGSYGGVIWSKEIEGYAFANNSTLAGSIGTRVDYFDGSLNDDGMQTIAIISYEYISQFGTTTITFDDEPSLPNVPFDVYSMDELAGNTVLVINGEEIQEATVFSYNYYDGEEPNLYYIYDHTMYYPRWKNPRMLHKSEDAQGGIQRCGVFQRVPFGP